MLAGCIHTGALESLHSVMLKYAPKRLDFDPASYNGRIQLAILDFNENIHRERQRGNTTPRIYGRSGMVVKKSITARELFLSNRCRWTAKAVGVLLQGCWLARETLVRRKDVRFP